MSGPGAEMPFLEHLEELRARLVRVVLALIVGFGVGLFVVQRFQFVTLLKAPIAPYLHVTGGKLVVTGPTEAVMITLKMALIVGLVLVSPVIIYQIWAFLAPALSRAGEEGRPAGRAGGAGAVRRRGGLRLPGHPAPGPADPLQLPVRGV